MEATKATVTHAVGLILICISTYYFVQAAESALFADDDLSASLPPEGTLGRQLATALLSQVDRTAAGGTAPGATNRGVPVGLPLGSDTGGMDWLAKAVNSESARQREAHVFKGAVWLVFGVLLLGLARRRPRIVERAQDEVPHPSRAVGESPLRRVEDSGDQDTSRYAPRGY